MVEIDSDEGGLYEHASLVAVVNTTKSEKQVIVVNTVGEMIKSKCNRY